ncbi:MAG: hypothetical protein AAF921_08815 [Cyanobacteria bacterium P01_D01_bin.44]
MNWSCDIPRRKLQPQYLGNKYLLNMSKSGTDLGIDYEDFYQQAVKYADSPLTAID